MNNGTKTLIALGMISSVAVVNFGVKAVSNYKVKMEAIKQMREGFEMTMKANKEVYDKLSKEEVGL